MKNFTSKFSNKEPQSNNGQAANKTNTFNFGFNKKSGAPKEKKLKLIGGGLPIPPPAINTEISRATMPPPPRNQMLQNQRSAEPMKNYQINNVNNGGYDIAPISPRPLLEQNLPPPSSNYPNSGMNVAPGYSNLSPPVVQSTFVPNTAMPPGLNYVSPPLPPHRTYGDRNLNLNFGKSQTATPQSMFNAEVKQNKYATTKTFYQVPDNGNEGDLQGKYSDSQKRRRKKKKKSDSVNKGSSQFERSLNEITPGTSKRKIKRKKNKNQPRKDSDDDSW